MISKVIKKSHRIEPLNVARCNPLTRGGMMIAHTTEQTPIPPSQPADEMGKVRVEFNQEELRILEKFNREFIESQKPLESEDAQLLEENIWDLI